MLLVVHTQNQRKNETADRLDIRNVENGAFDQFPDARILGIRRATEVDLSMQELQHLIITGWPKKSDISAELGQ